MDLDLIKPTGDEIAEVATLFPESDPRHGQLLILAQPTKEGDHGNILIERHPR